MMKWVLAACLGLFAVGCKQGIGDRCQVDQDCNTDQGLFCAYPGGAVNTALGGQCEPLGFVAPVDAGTDAAVDARPADAPVVPVDASVD
jgi:hypothetical protein